MCGFLVQQRENLLHNSVLFPVTCNKSYRVKMFHAFMHAELLLSVSPLCLGTLKNVQLCASLSYFHTGHVRAPISAPLHWSVAHLPLFCFFFQAADRCSAPTSLSRWPCAHLCRNASISEDAALTFTTSAEVSVKASASVRCSLMHSALFRHTPEVPAGKFQAPPFAPHECEGFPSPFRCGFISGWCLRACG